MKEVIIIILFILFVALLCGAVLGNIDLIKPGLFGVL